MIPMKKVARNWSLGLALLIAPSAWAYNKPKSSPAPKAAAHPAAKANSRTAAAGHAVTTNSGAAHPTVNHPSTAARIGAADDLAVPQTAASQQHRHDVGPVIAAAVGSHDRGPTEFAHHHD